MIRSGRLQRSIDMQLFPLWLAEQKQLLQAAIKSSWVECGNINTNYRAAFTFFRENNTNTTVMLDDMAKYFTAYDSKGAVIFPNPQYIRPTISNNENNS